MSDREYYFSMSIVAGIGACSPQLSLLTVFCTSSVITPRELPFQFRQIHPFCQVLVVFVHGQLLEACGSASESFAE